MALLITFFLGIFILIGALIAKSAKNHMLIEQLSVSVAFGTMLAMAFGELLPEAIEKLEGTKTFILLLCIIAGIAVLKLFDIFIPNHDKSHDFAQDCTAENTVHIGIMASIAIILHNIIEGTAVYSIAADSIHMGIMVALGVGLHNIPMGMMVYSTLSHERRVKKLSMLAAVAFSTLGGGIIMKLLWPVISDFLIGILISLSLGMIIYIVFFELLTNLMHRGRRLLSASGTVIGIALIIISGFFE